MTRLQMMSPISSVRMVVILKVSATTVRVNPAKKGHMPDFLSLESDITMWGIGGIKDMERTEEM